MGLPPVAALVQLREIDSKPAWAWTKVGGAGVETGMSPEVTAEAWPVPAAFRPATVK